MFFCFVFQFPNSRLKARLRKEFWALQNNCDVHDLHEQYNCTNNVRKKHSNTYSTVPWNLNGNILLFCNITLRTEIFAGINFRVSKKNAKYLTTFFAFGDFWNKFCGKNFREFKIKEMLASPKKKKKHKVLL